MAGGFGFSKQISVSYNKSNCTHRASMPKDAKPKPKPKPGKSKSKSSGGGGKPKQPERGQTRSMLKSMPLHRAAMHLIESNHESAAAWMAAAMACPVAFPSFRFQDGYDSLPTAPFAPFDIIDMPVDSGAGVDGYGIPRDENWIFAFRDPRRGILIYDHNSASQPWTYQMFGGPAGDNSFTLPANTDLSITQGTCISPFQPHGSTWLGASNGESDDAAYFCMGRGLTVAFTDTIEFIGGVPPSTSCQLALDYISDGVRNLATITVTSTAGGSVGFDLSSAVPPLPPGLTYVKPRTISVPLTNCLINILGDSCVMRHLPLGRFFDVAASIDAFRANGLSVMYSNTAPDLSKNGDAVGWQVPKSIPWDVLLKKGYSYLTNRPGAGQQLAKEGIQGFWVPSAPSDFAFLPVSSSWGSDLDYNGDAYQDLYPVSPQSDYLAICTRIPVADGRAGRYTICCAGEGRTSNPWFADLISDDNSRDTSERAVALLRGMPQWHSNPSHIKDILGWIRGHKGAVGDTLDAIGANFPQVSPFTRVMKQSLSMV